MDNRLPHICGSIQEIGKIKRKLYKDAFLSIYRNSACTPDMGRVSALTELLQRVSPEWLEEAEAFAGDHRDLYLDYQCQKPSPSPDTVQDANCSTLIVLGSSSKSGNPLLLKIRDEAPHPQVMFKQQEENRYTVLAGSNIGNMGFAQMANTAGLVGGNNTGGPLLDDSTHVGLNDCLILRMIAERCATCEEALLLLQQLADQDALGNGGYARGMIFLLADATGVGMIIECTRKEVFYRKYTEGIHLRTNHNLFSEMEAFTNLSRFNEESMKSSFERYHRMKYLAEEKQTLSIADLERISRDTEGVYPLCQTQALFPWQTVSSWVHEVDVSNHDISVSVCNAAPILSEYVPLHIKIST